MRIFSFFLEVLPLAGFFVYFHFYGIYVAAVVSVILGLFVLGVSWCKDKRLAPFPLCSILFSGAFTFAAIFFESAMFIKIQPTITNGFFSIVLLGGLYLGRPTMKLFFDKQFDLNHDTWVKLTYRWGYFFLILAIANEVVWRNSTESGWVSYKTFIIAPLSMLFMLAQLPLTLRGREISSKRN